MPKKPKSPAEPMPAVPTPAQLETARALFDNFRGAYSREGGYDIDVADVAEMVAAVEEPLQRRIVVLESTTPPQVERIATALERIADALERFGAAIDPGDRDRETAIVVRPLHDR